MKKLLLSLFTGAFLVGTGISMTVLELSVWDMADYPEYIDSLPVQTCEFIEEINLEEFYKIDFYIQERYYTYDKTEKVEIVEDKSMTDCFKIYVEYKGKQPITYSYNHTVYENDNDKEYLSYSVHGDNAVSFKEIRQVAEDMFENRICYREIPNTVIEKVTVYTAYPEKIDVLN